MVHSLADIQLDTEFVNTLKRLLYTAETSCYWYWTGQSGWDGQVTQAANKGMTMAQTAIGNLLKNKQDKTGPTIFVPWVRPANPGGKDWGQGGLLDAASQATFHTFVYDISGIKRVTLHYQKVESQTKKRVAMENKESYPSQTHPVIIANLYQTILPAGTGNIRYFIEAVDKRGNVSYSPVGRIHIA